MVGAVRAALPCLLLPAALAFGCAPEIGDPCTTSVDCSVQGERECDLTQPGGYCTVRSCDPDGCPDETICVQWRPEPPRSAESWCMQRCEDDGDCRVAEGYACVRPDDPRLRDGTGAPLTRILDLSADRAEARFCAEVALPSMP